MPWSPPVSPNPGTTILVAYATANIVDPITWLRLMTGNADPPAADYVVVSTSGTTTSWQKVPASALAAGAALASLGYTPVNKAGDASTGTQTVVKTLGASGGLYSVAHLVAQSGDAAVNPAEVAAVGFHRVNSNAVALFLDNNGWLRQINSSGTVADFWTTLNDGAGSGLDADTVDGKHALDLSPVGMIASFATLAELTAAGSSWTRYTAADGRLLVGAGTTFSTTFTEATNYGSNWTPAVTVSVNNGSLAASSSGIAATGATGFLAPTAGGTTATPPLDHTHPAPTITLSGSVASSGTGATWLPPSRAVIYGRRI